MISFSNSNNNKISNVEANHNVFIGVSISGDDNEVLGIHSNNNGTTGVSVVGDRNKISGIIKNNSQTTDDNADEVTINGDNNIVDGCQIHSLLTNKATWGIDEHADSNKSLFTNNILVGANSGGINSQGTDSVIAPTNIGA